jgi:hypothetical protein
MRNPFKPHLPYRSKVYDYLEYGAMAVLLAAAVIQVCGSFGASCVLLCESSDNSRMYAVTNAFDHPIPAASRPETIQSSPDIHGLWNNHWRLR